MLGRLGGQALSTHTSVALAITSLGLAPPTIAQGNSSGAWLDDGGTNWSQAEAVIPTAPPQDGDNFDNCAPTLRAATLPVDVQVAAAGWGLVGPAQIFGTTTVITGAANADGMCRPMAYQVFVFANGKFAGTLSPLPMDSRTDGSTSNVNLYRDGYITAVFNRYTPEDALCCPSGQSRLVYEVVGEACSPLLVPQWPASQE
jgi:hypothetical protein